MARRPPIAQRLAKELGGTWHAHRNGFGWMCQREEDGLEVRRYAEPVLDYDGYSDTQFRVVYIDSEGNYLYWLCDDVLTLR